MFSSPSCLSLLMSKILSSHATCPRYLLFPVLRVSLYNSVSEVLSLCVRCSGLPSSLTNQSCTLVVLLCTVSLFKVDSLGILHSKV